MNEVQTNTTVSVSSGVFYEESLQIARDILEGCYDDYYFFNSGNNEYILLVGDIEFSVLGCTASNCTCYNFRCNPVSSTQTLTVPFSGSTSGQNGGSYGVGGFSGSVSGNSTVQIQSETQYSYTYVYPTFFENVTIQNNSGYLVYASGGAFPHLIEGVQNYAFAAFLFAFSIVAFKLVDRLFRRVY